MKSNALSMAIASAFLASCSPYTNHLSVHRADSQESNVVLMKPGERKKIATRTRGSGINPVPTLGPAHYLSSSNPRILVIEGKPFDADAWAKAVSHGKVDIRYTGKDSGRDGQVTRVVVIP